MQSKPKNAAEQALQQGFAIVSGVLASDKVNHLRAAVAAIPDGHEVRRRRGVYGVRNLLEISAATRELAVDPKIMRYVCGVLGPEAFAVRAIFFDKVPGANWSLGWHQDSVISLREKHEHPGYLAWAQKAGVWQVQPPPEVLARMLAVRVHLDNCGAGNGPLKVIPNSHVHGWLDNEIDQWKERGPIIECCVSAGDLLLMNPMTLHASSAAESPDHRRVIHIEYACDELPGRLQWNNRVR